MKAKLQSASKAAKLMVRQRDKEGWFLGIYSPELVQNSQSLAGDEPVLDTINKYYSIPVQKKEGCLPVHEWAYLLMQGPDILLRMSIICSGTAYRLLYKRLWFDTVPYTTINLAGLIIPSETIFLQPRRSKIKQTLKLYYSTLGKKIIRCKSRNTTSFQHLY